MSVRVAERSADYHGCGGCVHNDDPSCMCQIRSCIHAFVELKECYQPKEAVPISKLDLEALKQFNEFLNDLIELKEK